MFSHIVYGHEIQFMYDDSLRSYIVFDPNLQPNPDGYECLTTPNLIPTARQEQFIVACPNALRHSQNPLITRWNAGEGKHNSLKSFYDRAMKGLNPIYERELDRNFFIVNDKNYFVETE